MVDSLHPAFDFIIFKFLDLFYVEAGELFPVVVITHSPWRKVSREGNRFALGDQLFPGAHAVYIRLKCIHVVISSVLLDLIPWLLG